jgi:hypothetical protein
MSEAKISFEPQWLFYSSVLVCGESQELCDTSGELVEHLFPTASGALLALSPYLGRPGQQLPSAIQWQFGVPRIFRT